MQHAGIDAFDKIALGSAVIAVIALIATDGPYRGCGALLRSF